MLAHVTHRKGPGLPAPRGPLPIKVGAVQWQSARECCVSAYGRVREVFSFEFITYNRLRNMKPPFF